MRALGLRVSRLTAAQAVWLFAGLAGVIHVFQLAPDLEDIDSINFALGLRHYAPALHQPHPPGYPLYIGLGRLALAASRLIGLSAPRTVLEAHALAIWSALGSAVAVVAVARVRQQLGRLTGDTGDSAGAWTALLLAANALFWLSGSRPLSDMPGLALALAAQALVLSALPGPGATAAPRRALVLGAGLAGLAIGVRTQTLWLTGPLLLAVLSAQPRGQRVRLWGLAIGSGALACFAWAVPMVVASGGLDAYLVALGAQAGEDFAYVDMVYANPTSRAVAFALYRTLVLPWGVDFRLSEPGIAGLAGVLFVLLLGAAGVFRLLLRFPRRLAWVAVAYLPYVVFHVVLQETVTVRYALPVMPLVVLLVVDGAYGWRRGATALLTVTAAWALTIAVPHGARYAAQANGAMQAVAAMAAVAPDAAPAFVTTHIALTRSVQAADVPGGGLLPPRMDGNWLALADYWTGGGVEPVWFLADPRRHDLDSIDLAARQDVSRFTWAAATLPELGGARPAEADWYRMRPPVWVVGDGWSLSPETGGQTQANGSGPHVKPALAWVRRSGQGVRLLVGGRLLAPASGAVTVSVELDGRPLESWAIPASGRFARFMDLPPGAVAGDGPYATVAVSAAVPTGQPPVPLALTQFEASDPSELVWAYGEGWHGPEVDAVTAERFRWTTGQAAIDIRRGGGDVRLRIRATSPPRGTPPEVSLRVGDQVLTSLRPSGHFVLETVVPAGALEAAGGRVTVVTSQTFSPAEAGSSDQRELGVKVRGIDIVEVR